MQVPGRDLTPCQAVAAVRSRVRKRIAALENVRLPEYMIVIHELRIVEDLLARAEAYIKSQAGKPSI
jgi:hypothetical protein